MSPSQGVGLIILGLEEGEEVAPTVISGSRFQYGEPVASMRVKDIMTHGLITASLGNDLAHLMPPDDPLPRAPHACAS
jgi:hypothetical protein